MGRMVKFEFKAQGPNGSGSPVPYSRENRGDFRWEGCLVGDILGERKWWDPTIFSLGPRLFSPPKKIGEKMGMRGEWMEVTHLPYHHP